MVFDHCMGAVRLVFRSVLDVLAPTRCVGCARAGTTGALCPECFDASSARPTQVSQVPVLALGPFAPPLSQAIKQLKYSGRTDLALPLAKLWWQRWGHTLVRTPQAAASVLLVPVPLHRGRLVERGFNQSALLATELARLARVRVGHEVIERVHATEHQARLAAHARAHNLDGAFRVSRCSAVTPGTRLVLVDDVVTTGATFAACQAACRTQNLSLCAVWALAHTERAGPRSQVYTQLERPGLSDSEISRGR